MFYLKIGIYHELQNIHLSDKWIAMLNNKITFKLSIF